MLRARIRYYAGSTEPGYWRHPYWYFIVHDTEDGYDERALDRGSAETLPEAYDAAIKMIHDCENDDIVTFRTV